MNNDCARKILLEVEKINFGETITVAKLQEIIPEFSIEEVLSIVTIFNREHFLIVLDKVSYDDNDVFRDHKIKGLTEKGYKTLDAIREDDEWNLIKEKMENFDNLSFFTIINIANRIMENKYNKLFDLPIDMQSNNNCW